MSTGCTSFRAFDAGFIASRDIDLQGNQRVRALGPVWDSRQSSTGMTFRAVRPFYSTIDDGQKTRPDVLWPIGTFKTSRGQRNWRFLNFSGHDYDVNFADSRYRCIGFPLLAMGRDAQGEDYFALFPLGGRIHEFMGQKRISFVLFPLYARTLRGDVDSRHILWPIYTRSRGERVSRTRVFPLYGTSSVEGKWRKRFIAWPIWTDVQYDDPKDQGRGFLLFPLLGSVRTEHQRSWTVLPPFFRSSRAPGRHEVSFPWPFIRYSSGEVDKLYIWPLWGTRKQGPLSKSFLLWPVGRSITVERNDELRVRQMLLPFIYSDKVTARGGDIDGVVTERYFKLWPLFMYRRAGDATRIRLPVLSPLKHRPSVERNYAPIWTLYSYESKQAASEHELLWGLVRQRTEQNGGKNFSIFPIWSHGSSTQPDRGKSWSLLKGFLGYEREGLKKQYRILYFMRFGTDRAESEE